MPPKGHGKYYPYALTLLDTSTYPLFWTIDPPLPTTHASLEHPASAPAEGAIQLTCSTEAVPWKTWQAETPPNSTWNLKMMVSKKKHISFSYKLLFWGSLLNFRGVLHFYQCSNFRKENQRLDCLGCCTHLLLNWREIFHAHPAGENTKTTLSGAGSMSFERFDAFRCRMFDVFDMNTMYRSGTYKGKKAGEREREEKKTVWQWEFSHVLRMEKVMTIGWLLLDMSSFEARVKPKVKPARNFSDDSWWYHQFMCFHLSASTHCINLTLKKKRSKK